MKITVAGLGLIGGSMAKALKKYTAHTVYGYDRDASAVTRAVLENAIDSEADENAIASSDVLIVALYPQATVDFVAKYAPKIKKKATVIDCCGTKQFVCQSCFPIADEYGFEFVGGHPMAGTQYSGFGHSRANLFKDASMIIVPREADHIFRLEKIKNFFTQIGFKTITVTDAATHDRNIAYTSQLAHVVSNAYVKSPSSQVHKGFSAGSFKDLTRVAKLNEDMWTELFLQNGKFLADEIDNIIVELQKYSTAIKNNDAQALRELLKEGRILKEKSEKSKSK